MSVWAVLQHVPFEGPGLIAVQAHAHGIELDERHLYRGDTLPSLDQLAGLVVLGGPMGVGDTEQYPHLAAEIDLLAGAVAADMPVLGVCLGAQLLACALGGQVGSTGSTEVGIGSVALTPAGERDGVLGPSGRFVPVLHWHDDMFTIPPGAELLASSDRCVNQAFRAGRAYGLQFHVELDGGLVASMRPHLPIKVALDAGDVAAVENVGSTILGRFFDAAQHQSQAPGA
ncbi:MAG TPA: type 1 glutamine amidotransferase [Solirubrobacteraceae bacterium]|jgi:GMP synthase (glutamine-hydrolysing)|nr:type 1 glutamine amidotransferase [Solirubrobacteraceae bacterium]